MSAERRECPKCHKSEFAQDAAMAVLEGIGPVEIPPEPSSRVLRCVNPDCGARVEFILPNWNIGRVWAR